MAASRTACTLTIVGDGPARAELERLAGELGLGGQVVFSGIVSPEAVAAVVSGFDIALQPKATSYASPLKIFDYMAAGCAIVAPDQANIREVLRDGENAVLFDAAAPGAMWRAVEGLVGDASRRARLGAAARAAVEVEGRTWAANAARVVALARG
jgi:glycosyltransferase involved in cell wall biosynthesis